MTINHVRQLLPVTAGTKRNARKIAGRIAMLCLATSAAVCLAACGNLSHDVAKNGSGAGQLVWPSPESATPMHKGGTFPAPAQLQSLRYGMNKQQIAALIGYPHFNEGIWEVREWNYLFDFREDSSDRVEVCQFKVLFDQHKIARSFYWLPESCSRHMAVAVEPALAKAPEQQMSFSTDAMFKFDRASIDDITNDGHAQLDTLAKNLIAEQAHVSSIRILGYSDRLGNDTYDLALSEQRAHAVMDYLVDKGVPQNLMVAEGRGKSDALKTCAPMPRDALIACLAPNRRVAVQVHTRAQ